MRECTSMCEGTEVPFLGFLLPPLHDICGLPQTATILLIFFTLDPQTDQPFSCGAPATAVHQEIASGSQDSQQDP